jgi:hypothetical protein
VRVLPTSDQAEAIIDLLPERTPVADYPIRALFTVIWDTSLRIGTMWRDETSPCNFDVTVTQNLSFTIDVTIAAVAAQVVIVTNSSTVLTGTGTGSAPGTITLDPLTAPFNINAAATGITNCTATNLATGVDVSDAICPLAGLMGGDNPLPFAGDPFMRTFPPIAVGASTFALGAGPADPTGWYLSNPPALAGNGTQWVGLSGVLQ